MILLVVGTVCVVVFVIMTYLAMLLFETSPRTHRPYGWRLFSARAKAQWLFDHGYSSPDGWHVCEHCKRRVVELRWPYCFLCDEAMSMGMGDTM